MKYLNIGLMLATFALAGCESMSASECQVADWGRVGFNDGARGEAPSRLSAYTEDCGKVGVQPNPKAYRQGWDNGITRFCTAANGWREGTQGHSGKDSVCRGQYGYEAFRQNLEAGLQVYRTNEQINKNNSQSNRLQKQLDESKRDDEKRRLRSELREIDRDQYYLRNQLNRQQMQAP